MSVDVLAGLLHVQRTARRSCRCGKGRVAGALGVSLGPLLGESEPPRTRLIPCRRGRAAVRRRRQADDTERRLLNQAFFERIEIGTEEIDDNTLSDPFKQIAKLVDLTERTASTAATAAGKARTPAAHSKDGGWYLNAVVELKRSTFEPSTRGRASKAGTPERASSLGMTRPNVSPVERFADAKARCSRRRQSFSSGQGDRCGYGTSTQLSRSCSPRPSRSPPSTRR